MSRSTASHYQTVVTAVHEVAPDVICLNFKRKWPFAAGQVVGVAIELGDTPRMYSLSGGTDDRDGEIIFDVRPQGQLTPKLRNLRVGDPLLVSEPFGEFVGTPKPAWWIATGTGIAPFASMLRSGFHQHKKLIHGSRNGKNFYFQELFADTLGDDYIRCCSGESNEKWFDGRVTDWLSAQQDLPTDVLYYLCGNAEMVVDVRDLLISKKIPYDLIQSEIFF